MYCPLPGGMCQKSAPHEVVKSHEYINSKPTVGNMRWAGTEEHGTRSYQEKGASVARERAGGVAQGAKIHEVTIKRIENKASACRELIYSTTKWECPCTPSNILALNNFFNLAGCAEHE